MQQGSPEWLDLHILNQLDRSWDKKGKWLSAWELLSYFTQQGHDVPLETINERLYILRLHGSIEAMYAPNGKGPNALYLLRYSRTRARY
jgi:hypothetical protein